MKKLLSLLLCPILMVSFVACKKASGTMNINENKLSIEEAKEGVKNYEDNISAEDLIEMRGSNLWLSIEDINNLSLDGKPYKLPEELIDHLNFSHVKINYPLMIFNTDNIYNMETKEVIFTAGDIVLNLEEEWGKTMGINEVNPYGNMMELEPEFFNFIDNVTISPSKGKVAFSVHVYFAASFSSITGTFHIDSNKIEFVEGPFMGQVQEISWSPDENYFAYTSGSADDKYDIHIINSRGLKKLVSISSIELLEESREEHFYVIPTLDEWLDKGYLSIQLRYIGIESNIEKSVITSIKYDK